jgi:hypothetical protein
MKTKTFLLLCLFLGIGLTQLSAQNGKNGTNGSYSEYFTVDGWTQGAYCNGNQVDLLMGTLTFHHIGHYLKGDWIWCKTQCVSGELVSIGFKDKDGKTIGGTGETFSVHEIQKQVNNIQPNGDWLYVDYCHFNLLGNKGTHYIGTIIWDYTGAETSASAICN